MPITLVEEQAVERRSTEAAADFVAATRLRMRMEIMRHGDAAVRTRRYRCLADGIRPDTLRAFWPRADIDAALRHGDDSALEAELLSTTSSVPIPEERPDQQLVAV